MRKYLKGFEQKAKALSIAEIAQIHQETWIDQFFLPKDSNSLSFEVFKQGFYDKPEPIIQHFQASFFKNYELDKPSKKVEDAYLVQEFNNSLQSFSPQKRSLIKAQFPLKTDLMETVFDFGWQNGTTNLVKSQTFLMLMAKR